MYTTTNSSSRSGSGSGYAIWGFGWPALETMNDVQTKKRNFNAPLMMLFYKGEEDERKKERKKGVIYVGCICVQCKIGCSEDRVATTGST